MNGSACICDLLFRARTEKNQTAVSKHLGVLPNIRRNGNSARIWVKTASSAAIIVSLVVVYLNCDVL